MKKTSLFTSFGFCTALLFVGCSDNDAKDIAGTVVDPNELAEAISSSSADEELPSSSSAIPSSSSIIISSSSSSIGQTAPVDELDSNSLGYYLLQYGHEEEGRKGFFNQWPLEDLQKDDFMIPFKDLALTSFLASALIA